MSNTQAVRAALNILSNAKQLLTALGVMRSERLTGEIGEWLFAELYDGQRASSATQKDWDVRVGTVRYQIKTHAKRDDNPARWTNLKENLGEADFLVIIALTSDYRLEEFYVAPRESVHSKIRLSGKFWVIEWDRLAEFRMHVDDLPKQNEIIRHFR